MTWYFTKLHEVQMWKRKERLSIKQTPIRYHYDQKYETRKSENNIVMSWPINSMTTEIGEGFLLLSTISEVWEATRETDSDQKNYISKLTCMKNCIAIFHSHNCIFQDLNLGKMIGNAKEPLGLYVLNVLKSQVKELSFSTSALMFLKTIMIVQLCYGIIV